MEWTLSLLMADDQWLPNLMKGKRPFYQSPGFLKQPAAGLS